MNIKGHCYPESISLQAEYFKLRFTLSYQGCYRNNENEGSLGGPQFSVGCKGKWCYLFRAVDKSGKTVDFLLTKRRQRMSAQSFLIKAIANYCKPEIINSDFF